MFGKNYLSLVSVLTAVFVITGCESWPRYKYDQYLSKQVHLALKEARKCSEKYLKKESSVIFDIVVDESGSTHASKVVSGSFGVPEIDECYLSNLKSMKLDPPPLKYSEDKVYISRKNIVFSFVDDEKN
tara:strand:+ start:21349 stop:21735 length:387 start_codon:yes stop_codon:yes gene_type:complete